MGDFRGKEVHTEIKITLGAQILLLEAFFLLNMTNVFNKQILPSLLCQNKLDYLMLVNFLWLTVWLRLPGDSVEANLQDGANCYKTVFTWSLCNNNSVINIPCKRQGLRPSWCHCVLTLWLKETTSLNLNKYFKVKSDGYHRNRSDTTIGVKGSKNEHGNRMMCERSSSTNSLKIFLSPTTVSNL